MGRYDPVAARWCRCMTPLTSRHRPTAPVVFTLQPLATRLVCQTCLPSCIPQFECLGTIRDHSQWHSPLFMHISASEIEPAELCNLTAMMSPAICQALLKICRWLLHTRRTSSESAVQASSSRSSSGAKSLC
ncbi:hypothetical protein DAEQUDRAFT_170750 [Daedalea quercina L-15889]|uniref:Uncharacterized protein n=1 Tax=Daedalea quercina L-15889 TaxID=1314783 RepID=A0A165RKB5_9APHY|nr:hypothetical protein DAEQUDRAFT_170750 [Daedalea quercina L-15889]